MTSDEAFTGTAAQRWRQYLLDSSVEYRGLQQERERGWQSAALDRWYAERHASTKTDATKGPDGTPGVASSFHEADVSVLCGRYQAHVRRLVSSSPALQRVFRPAPTSTATSSSDASSVVTFVDLGCAPGGVSKFLCDHLHWRGAGVTLADKHGGIAMEESLLARHVTTASAVTAATLRGGGSVGDRGMPHDGFLLLEGDVAASVAAWSVHASTTNDEELAHKTGKRRRDSPATACMPVMTALEALRAVSGCAAAFSETAPGYHFVNGGAVQDYGQRLHGARTGEVTASSAALKRPRTEDADAQLPAPAEGAGAILPWFTLFVPQLRFALEHVRQGGAAMIVYGVPQCASCCIWLRAMEVFLPPEDKQTTGPHVHVLETMHLVKSPVYLLWERLNVAGQQSAVERLLASADPTSSVLCPVAPSLLRTNTQRELAETAEKTLAALPPSERTAFKRQFWLGESDLGFALAHEGFVTYGPSLARLWESARMFHASRRARAEASVAAASHATPVESGAAPSARRGRGTFRARERD